MKGFLVTHTSHYIHESDSKKHGGGQFPGGGNRD